MRTVRLVLPAVLLACCGGCFEDDAVWLPDSSGVVYIRSDHCLVRYDLATKTETVLARHDWLCSEGGSGRPAVSPDGQQVAVVRHSASREAETVQILAYDLSGKPTITSSQFTLPGHKEYPAAAKVATGRAFWSPDGRRILVSLCAPLETKADEKARNHATLAVYDLAADANKGDSRKGDRHLLCEAPGGPSRQKVPVPFSALKVYPELLECEETEMFGLSPFSPDNRGFLAERDLPPGEKKGMEALVFVDWEGVQHPFTETPAVTELMSTLTREGQAPKPDPSKPWTPPKPKGAVWPVACWHGAVAQMEEEEGWLRIDTGRGLVTYTVSDDGQKLFKYAQREAVDLVPIRDGVLLEVRTERLADYNSLQHIAFLIRARQGSGWTWSRKSVAVVTDVEGYQVSPDRQRVLLHYTKDKDKASGRLIVDTAGNVLADLKR